MIDEFACPYCGLVVKSIWGLRRHVRISHPLNSTCPVCKKNCKDVLKHLNHASRCCREHMKYYLVHSANHNRRRMGIKWEVLSIEAC